MLKALRRRVLRLAPLPGGRRRAAPRFAWIGCLLAVCLGVLLPSPARGMHLRPNIVFILADDLGWGDVGFHQPEVLTPNLDRMAHAGVQLNRHYVLPICSPTRAALLTGLYPMRYGLQNAVVPENASEGLPLQYPLLSEDLKKAGYNTAIIGKWHLGEKGLYRPMERGFAYQYGLLGGLIDYYSHNGPGGMHDWYRGEQAVWEPGYSTELLGHEAVQFIKEQNDHQPFFLYLPFNATHGPINHVPHESLARYAGSALSGARLRLAATVSAMDDQVGNVVRALEQRGLLENTLVIFSSDNGGLAVHGSSNAPLREGKGSYLEGGVRVPTLVSWKGTLAPAVVDEPVHVVDWYPTLAGLAGFTPRPSGLDGLDIWPTIARGAPSPHPDLLINAFGSDGAICAGPWKLVERGGVEELFNVAEDPSEATNRISQQPQMAEALRRRLREYQAAQASPLFHPLEE